VKNANPEPSDHGHSFGIGNLPNVGFTPAAVILLLTDKLSAYSLSVTRCCCV
jgi:hypothetical protein